MKRLLFLLLVFSVTTLFAQEQNQEHKYSFRLVSTPGFIELHAEEGCNWLSLSFSLWQGGDAVIVNQNGMLGSDVQKMEEHHEQSTFLLKIQRTEEGLEITSFKGTEWAMLDSKCEEEYCSFIIDEKGITPFKE